MNRAALLTLALLLGSCTSEQAPAPTPAPAASQADPLASLASRRETSSGAELERQLQEARALNRSSTQALALGEDEDYPVAAAPKHGAARASAGGSLVGDVASAGESAPSDLDMADTSAPQTHGGYINMEDVDAAVRGQRDAIQRCRDKLGGSSGNMDFELRVGGGGQASRVRYVGGSMRDEALSDCIAGVLKRTRFPRVYKGDVTFTYPITF